MKTIRGSKKNEGRINGKIGLSEWKDGMRMGVVE